MILDIKRDETSNNTLPSVLKYGVLKATEEFFYTKADPSKDWGNEEKTLYVFDNIENPKPFIRLYQKPVVESRV